MRTAISLAVNAGCFLLLVAPLAAQTQKTVPQRPLYPLTLGSEWTYQAGEVELIEKVGGFDEINGEWCARIEVRMNGKLIASEHIVVRKDGVYRTAIMGDAVVPPLCFLKLPPQLGETWEVKSTLKEEPISGRFTIERETVQTPSGSEQVAICSRGSDFQVQGQPLNFTYYFVPGIGKVRQIVSAGDKKTTLELKSYRIAPAATPATNLPPK
ncbi:hypothetical protein [Planctomicrobium sp. SH664]|uniref:hypothetical protein n=1 Tax=Planctomicrobium sp. SH664 TaxID=3448125 RepID=UPI003F5B91BB